MRTRVLLTLVLALLVAPAVAADDSARLDALITAAKSTMMADPAAALRNAEAAAVLAETRSGKKPGEAVATSLWLEAEALTRLNRMADAQRALDRAVAIAERDGKITTLDGNLAMANARIADNNGDVALALRSYQKAHDIFAKLGAARSRSMALQGLGSIYDEAHDFTREIRYYTEANRVYSQDPALELSVANNLGNAMQQMGRYDEAVTHFKRALALSRQLKSEFLEESIVSNLAAVYAKQHRFADAQKAADTALRLLRKNGDASDAPFVWGVKAEVDYERGAIGAAAGDLDRAFAGVDLKTTISPFRDMHEIAYKVYRAQGNYPLAMAHLEAFKRLDDQGRSLAASANLALIGAQFDFARQQFEIEHLQSEQLKRDISLRESRAATQNVIFGAAFIGAIILMLWAGWRNVVMRRHRNAIEQKNVALTRTLAERDVEIARRKETEDQLRLAMEAAEQANRAKSHFLANMSHELRTPLNAIIGFSELMALGAAKGPKLTEYATDINKSGQSLLTILNDILDMARIDAGTVTLAEDDLLLGDVVESAVCEIENAKNAAGKTIVFGAANRDVCVRGDDKRLRQVVLNLLSNAVKFTGPDGRIEARIERVADGVDVVVCDNGIGIPDDKIGIIMEPFGQAESAYARLHGGVGLGLPIVKSLVQMHGGRFTLQSETGEGTTARMHLPLERLVVVPHTEKAARAS